MTDVEKILKKILLNMKYDSRKTLTENTESTNQDCIPFSFQLDEYKLNELRSKQYPELGKYGDGKCKCERDPCLRYDKNCCQEPEEPKNVLFDDSLYKTYQTVIPNELITVPMITKYSTYVITPIGWHDVNEAYNEDSATQIFGTPCKKIAGLIPKYPLGWNAKESYFIKSDGTRCKSLGMKEWWVENTTSDKTYDYLQKAFYNTHWTESGTNVFAGKKFGEAPDLTNIDKPQKEKKYETSPYKVEYYYRKKNETNWTKSSGESERSIQEKITFTWETGYGRNGYDDGCKPLDYNVCLRWSWKSLGMSGVDGGLKYFKYESKDGSKNYSACIKVGGNGDENGIKFPWFSVYKDFYDDSQLTTYYDEIGVEKQGCRGLPNLSTIPDFVINGSGVGSLNKKQKEELEKLYQSKQSESWKYIGKMDSYDEIGPRGKITMYKDAEIPEELTTSINSVSTLKAGAIIPGT